MSATKKQRLGRTAEDIIALIKAEFDDARDAYFMHRGRHDQCADFGGDPERVFSDAILGGPGGKFRPGEDEKLAEYFAEHEQLEAIKAADFFANGAPRLATKEDPEAEAQIGAAKVDIIRAGILTLLQEGSIHISMLRAAHELTALVEPHLPVELIEHVQTEGVIDDHMERLLGFLGATPYEEDDDESGDADFIAASGEESDSE